MESAISRAPTEIWRSILELAVKVRLSPSETTSSLEDMQLLEAPCPSYQRLLRSEQIRTRLRLVCRSWNETLKEIGDASAVTNWSSNYLPSSTAYKKAKRIQVTFRPGAGCTCRDGTCPLLRSWRRPFLGLLGNEIQASIPRSCEALLLSRNSRNIRHFLDNAPSLKVLSWAEDCLPKERLIFTFQVFKHLTHLYIMAFYGCTIPPSGNFITFPMIQMLWINFEFDDDDEEEEESFSATVRGSLTTWRFPQLRRLRLDGECENKVWKDIHGMLETCGSTVSELILTVAPFITPETRVMPEHVQKHFPNLVVFGTTLDYYETINHTLENNPLKPSLDFIWIQFASGNLSNPQKALSQITQIWHPRRFLVDISWDEARRTLESPAGLIPRTTPTEARIAILDGLVAHRIPIYDIDGIGVKDPAGEAFWNWLRETVQPTS